MEQKDCKGTKKENRGRQFRKVILDCVFNGMKAKKLQEPAPTLKGAWVLEGCLREHLPSLPEH